MDKRFQNVTPWECSDEEYFGGDHYGSSSICRALGFDGPSGETGDFGNACHLAVLQPDLFHERVTTPPPDVSVGSGTGQKERMKEWRSKNAGKLILGKEDYAKALAMRDSMVGHHLVGPHLDRREIVFERSFRAIDSVTGLHVRVRCDALSPGVVDDMKTSKSPSFHAFSRAVISYGYHVQAALYVDVMAGILGRTPRLFWLVVGKTAPFRVGIYEASHDWLELGRRFYSAGLDVIAASRLTGKAALPWWSTKPLVLEPPPEYLDTEASLHERHAAALMGGVQ
jgi:hypothetical protein